MRQYGDANGTSNTTRNFFATVQNRMHIAVHGHTAAQLIYTRADAEKEHMGLTTWENAPDGKIQKTDVVIAKNYLSQDEVSRYQPSPSGSALSRLRLAEPKLSFAERRLVEVGALKRNILYFVLEIGTIVFKPNTWVL